VQAEELARHDSLSARSSSFLLWASVTARHCSPHLARLLTRALVADICKALLNDLSMVAWALATAQGSGSEGIGSEVQFALDALMARAADLLAARTAGQGGATSDGGRKARQADGQRVATIAWAAASLQHPIPSEFVRAVADASLTNQLSLSPQATAMLLWGIAVAAEEEFDAALPLFEAAAPAVEEAARDYEAPDISMVLYAYAKRGTIENKLFEACTRRLTFLCRFPTPDAQGRPVLSAADVATIAWAYGAMGHPGPASLFELLAAQALEQVDSILPSGLCMVAWAFATLGHPCPALFAAVRGRLERGQQALGAERLCIILWALAVAGELTSATAAAVKGQLCHQDLSTMGLSQLYAAELVLQTAEDSPPGSLHLMGSPRMMLAARQAWMQRHQDGSSRHSRAVYSEIAGHLAALGLPCEHNLTTEDGLVPVKLACNLSNGTKVAVEVYWNHLCTTTSPRRPLGGALLRARLMEAHGWRVLGITASEWHRPERESHTASQLAKARRKLLEEALADILPPNQNLSPELA